MLTSSVVVSLRGVPGFQSQATNLGLQLKNKSSKVQVSDAVIYDNKLNSFYFRSDVCETIRNYKQKYPQVIAAINKHIRKQLSRGADQGKMHILDIYPDAIKQLHQDAKNQQHQDSKIQQHQDAKQDPTQKLRERVEQIQNWLSQQPISKLPLVPLGTYTLPHQVIDKLIQTPLENSYQYDPLSGIQVNSYFLFNEKQPFWMGYAEEEYGGFQLGDRVINIKSSGREYIKFGLFGTVVGYTIDDKILVLFDEPIFAGYKLAPMIGLSWGQKFNQLYLVSGILFIAFFRRMKKIQSGEYQAYYGFQATQQKKQVQTNADYGDDQQISQKWIQDHEEYYYKSDRNNYKTNYQNNYQINYRDNYQNSYNKHWQNTNDYIQQGNEQNRNKSNKSYGNK